MRTHTRSLATLLSAVMLATISVPPVAVLAADEPVEADAGDAGDAQPDTALAAVCGDVPAAPFLDRDAAGVHAEAVDCVAHWAIASGRPDGRFDPSGSVTRGQMATFTVQLLLTAGVDLPAPARSFDDTASTVHRRAIERLATAGVLSGRSDDRFDPNEPVTRAQAATILVNALTTGGATPATADRPSFPDVTTGPHVGTVSLASASGVMAGYPDGTFRPGLAITRAQMAATLARTLGQLVAADPERRTAAQGVSDTQLAAELCLRNDADEDLARADEVLAGRYSLDPHRTVSVPRLDWTADPLTQDNWRFQFHTLRWLWPLLHAAEYTGDGRYLDHAYLVAEDWIANNPFDAPPSPFSWDDHAAAWRLKVFTCLSLQGDTPGWLLDSIVEHRNRMADPSFYVRYGNHALNQNLGMLAAACHTRHWDLRDLAVERISHLAQESIDVDGVSNEQAVEYQDYNYFRYRAAAAVHDACGVATDGWREQLPRMLDVLVHMTQPDGTYAPLGDTDRRPARFAEDDPGLQWVISSGQEGTPPTRTFASYGAGYTFARSGWGVDRPATDENYLALRHGPARVLHGHDDHGALLLFADGQPLLTDPGKYAYGDTAERAHVRTAVAHNRVTIEPCPPSWGSSAVADIVLSATTDRISVEVAVCDRSRWVRTVAFLRDSGTTVVLDELDAVGTATQRWQLEPGARVAAHGHDLLDVRWPSGARLAIEQLLPVERTTVVSGGNDPLRGWVSEVYGQLTPAANIATVAPDGARRDLVTVLRPGGDTSTYRSRLTVGQDSYEVTVHDGDRSHTLTLPRLLQR